MRCRLVSPTPEYMCAAADAAAMTSRAALTLKRPSTVPTEAVIKPPCKIRPLAIVADRAQLTGIHTIELGEHSVLHPYCRIRADSGRVTIGKYSTVSEAAEVGVSDGDGDVVIGDGVNIEPGAVVEAKSIGDWTVIEAKAKIGKGAVIGKVCLK